MKLRFTPRAVENIAEIADYLRPRHPVAAERVRAAIYDTLQTLLLFPHVGRRQSVEGVRKIVTRRYSYLIYSTIDDTANEITVLAVKHPARERDYTDR